MHAVPMLWWWRIPSFALARAGRHRRHAAGCGAAGAWIFSRHASDASSSALLPEMVVMDDVSAPMARVVEEPDSMSPGLGLLLDDAWCRGVESSKLKGAGKEICGFTEGAGTVIIRDRLGRLSPSPSMVGQPKAKESTQVPSSTAETKICSAKYETI